MKPTYWNDFEKNEILKNPEPLKAFEELNKLQERLVLWETTPEDLKSMLQVLENICPYLNSQNLPDNINELSSIDRQTFNTYLIETSSLRLFLLQQWTLENIKEILSTMWNLEGTIETTLENNGSPQALRANIQTLIRTLSEQKESILTLLRSTTLSTSTDKYLIMIKQLIQQQVLAQLTWLQTALFTEIKSLSSSDVSQELKDLAVNEIVNRLWVDLDIEWRTPGIQSTVRFGLQSWKITIDRNASFPGANQDRLLDGITQNPALRQALTIILWDFEWKYTRGVTTSVVSRQYEKSLWKLWVWLGDNTYLLEWHAGAEVSTALLSQTWGLANPQNLSVILPGWQEVFAIRNLIKDWIENTWPREQKSFSIYMWASLSKQFEISAWTLTHQIWVNWKFVVDETFTAWEEFFEGTDVLDRIRSIPGVWANTANLLEEQLTQFPWKYLILGLPVATGWSISYEMKFIPTKIEWVELSLLAEYERLIGKWFTTSNVQVLWGVNINLSELLRKKRD
jgi:hypothetical protein